MNYPYSEFETIKKKKKKKNILLLFYYYLIMDYNDY